MVGRHSKSVLVVSHHAPLRHLPRRGACAVDDRPARSVLSVVEGRARQKVQPPYLGADQPRNVSAEPRRARQPLVDCKAHILAATLQHEGSEVRALST